MMEHRLFEELRNEAVKHREPISLPNGSVGIILPKDHNLHEAAPKDVPLTHVKQKVTLYDEASFVEYVNAFKTEHTRVFGLPGFVKGTPYVAAIFDYHKPQKGPDRTDHIAVFKPQYSEQWNVWRHNTGDEISQHEFAEFIEEKRADIVTPSAAELIDLIQNFKASKKVEFDSVTYQPNGDIKIGYEERTTSNGAIDVPDKLTIGIPIYFMGDAYSINVLMRYRMATGAVKFVLKMDRPDIMEADAFNSILNSIKTGTDLPMHIGEMG